MFTRFFGIGILSILFLVSFCGESDSGVQGDNPFLQDQTASGKEDTFYVNPDGIEVEIDLEAEVQSSEWRIFEAPADLGQYVLTYLRKRNEFYLESLAEDAHSSRRVEWLVDGKWLSAEEAKKVEVSKLSRFKIRGMNAVLLFAASDGVKVGTAFKAVVPLKPHDTMSEAKDSCADKDSHLGLDQSTYWYLWNPDKKECKIATQDAAIVVSKMFQSDAPSYPEYDKLIADGKITAVVIFGQIGDGEITESDSGMQAFARMAENLLDADFEEKDTETGRRFSKKVGEITFEIDLYSPKEFSGLSDYAHFDNFQKAISEHEIVVYDGHSMLGASDFWGKPKYPSFYQIYLYGGCLGYEYYLKPILDGKGGWGNLDIVSSVVEVSVDANEYAAPFFSKLMFTIKNGYKVSWQDYLKTIRKSVGDSTFGASGVRENCYSPSGSRCSQ